MRLSVVVGNLRAERFWPRQGFVELRRREGVDTGGRLNTVRVMLKPLLAASAEDGPVTTAAVVAAVAGHFERVPRDHPDSTLP